MVIQCLFPKVKNRLDLGIQIQRHPSMFLFLLATPCSHMGSCFPNQGLNPWGWREGGKGQSSAMTRKLGFGSGQEGCDTTSLTNWFGVVSHPGSGGIYHEKCGEVS